MEAPGRAVIEQAKGGRHLDEVEDLIVPDDLAAAFDAHPGARPHWDEFPPWSRRAILEWIVQSKRG